MSREQEFLTELSVLINKYNITIDVNNCEQICINFVDDGGRIALDWELTPESIGELIQDHTS